MLYSSLSVGCEGFEKIINQKSKVEVMRVHGVV